MGVVSALFLGHGRGVASVPGPRAWCRLCSCTQGVLVVGSVPVPREWCQLCSWAQGVVSPMFLYTGRVVGSVPRPREWCWLCSWAQGAVSPLFLDPRRRACIVPGPLGSHLLWRVNLIFVLGLYRGVG